MGEVYRARDARLGREVAVKILPPSLSGDADRLRRFEQEARAAAALNHPNIVAVHDIGTHSSGPYIVSELLEGETLRTRLASGALSARKAVDYGIQLAHGLAAAHEKGIVHRDLKPENAFVTEDGRLKILDFGLAKLKPAPAGLDSLMEAPTQTFETEPGVVMGTVGYMSPEQVRGQPADHRSDIFALGAMLYEMLTGERAFRGGSAFETMSAILKEEPPEPSRFSPAIAPALHRIVRRCLEKSPAERFQSARDLAFALGEAVSVPSTVRLTAGSPGRRLVRVWPVLGASLLVLLAILFWFNVGGVRDRLAPGATTGRIQSIAVLPLTNFSRDPEQEYFADGMTEALITDLAQIRALRVISRTSVMMYRAAQKPLPQIGKELNVDAVLEGSVQKSGERVLVTAQLIHAASDRHLWAKSYERDMKDVLSLQSEIARSVATEIRATVSPDEAARLAGAKPVDPEVHELYLKGRFHFNAGTEEEIEKAIGYFEQALAKAPTYAPVYAGLADCYRALSDFYRAPFEVMPKAKAAAQRALDLDESLAEAHTALGVVHLLWDWDWPGAERELKRAIDLKPSYGDAHSWYASLLSAMARHGEAVTESRQAQQYDPLSVGVNFWAGLVNFQARRFDQAIVEFRKAVDVQPHFGMAHAGIAISQAQKHHFAEAVVEAGKGRQVDDSPICLAMAGGVYAAVGEKGKARQVLRELVRISARRYVCPYEIAIIHIGLGEKDEAFRLLEKGFQDRSICMPFTKVDPRLAPLRSDARYADLVRRIGFPP